MKDESAEAKAESAATSDTSSSSSKDGDVKSVAAESSEKIQSDQKSSS
jgi:hypothetical protein